MATNRPVAVIERQSHLALRNPTQSEVQLREDPGAGTVAQ